MAAQEPVHVRFAREFGWRAYAIPVLMVITVLVLWDVVAGDDDAGKAGKAPAQASHVIAPGHDHDADGEKGPDPATALPVSVSLKELPPGGPYAESGERTYRTVGRPGADVGQGTEKVVRYRVQVENGVDTVASGGDDALATFIDATLANPKGWIADPRFRFVHVGPDEDADIDFQLTSLETTHALCGASLEMETSCYTSDGNRVVINHSRWVRGAKPFQGDIGSYRQYLINHELGHGLGYAAHVPCGADGALAPVMMQQTLSLNNAELYRIDPDEVYPNTNITCRANAWPYPTGNA